MLPMKLATYLQDAGITYADFAKMIGASAFAVGKWARGDRIPRPAAMRLIAEKTKGQVTASDFFSPAASSLAEAS